MDSFSNFHPQKPIDAPSRLFIKSSISNSPVLEIYCAISIDKEVRRTIIINFLIVIFLFQHIGNNTPKGINIPIFSRIFLQPIKDFVTHAS